NPRVVMSVRLSGGLQKELKYCDFVSLYKKRRINPGQGLSTTVRLDRGELRRLLRRCPQETVTIRISCILDPQVVGQDEYLPSLGGQASKEAVLVRYGFRPSPKAMERLYQVLREGPVRSKIHTTVLLGDLLANSQNPQAIAEAKKPRSVNEEQITAALVERAQDADWRVRAWLGEALQFARLDEQLSKALADQIRDPHWFVRLMAVRAAGNRGQNWREILRRVAETDSDPLVRQMASIYVSGGAAAEDK
ncbi:MAG: HEAT repeat domain-containing protein, partial [Phycisphaerae bacterium]|nr:HEAT repeat domain-containing protein [Phycisphaerae bacterium]